MVLLVQYCIVSAGFEPEIFCGDQRFRNMNYYFVVNLYVCLIG